MITAARAGPPRRLKILSRLALLLAPKLPRGHWRLTKFAADRDPALWDIPIPLASIPGAHIRADLRETVFMNFLRYGCIPGQAGHDRLFAQLVKRGDTVFDIGANVGYTMLIFSHLVGPDGKVVAMEPGRRAFAGLARNAEKLSNVALLQVAASDRVGEATFHETPMSDISSLEHVAGAVEFSVPTTTADRVAQQQGAPDFVKIDVEGHEPSVLRGLAGLIGSARPPILLFEALDKRLREECVATIASLAAEPAPIFRLRSDGTLASDLEGPGTNDYLFVPAWAAARLG